MWVYCYGFDMMAMAYRCPSEARDDQADPRRSVAAGTDEKPASLGEIILAAIDLWERLYGTAAASATPSATPSEPDSHDALLLATMVAEGCPNHGEEEGA